MASMYYRLIYDSIDRTVGLYSSRHNMFKASLLRTILYINNIQNDEVDNNVLTQVKYYVQLADLYNDLYCTTKMQLLILPKLEKAKNAIRNHILYTGLFKNRYYSESDIGEINKLPLDCQKLIIELLK
jgi:hypothetical protein